MSATLLQDGDVLVREERALRRLTLNRPKALNALTLDMAVTMTALLRAWAGDRKVGAVLIDGAGERGLCAGGDIRALYDAAKANSDLPARFWSSEYHLDVLIARYPKPVIAVMDGVVMGGGVGLSAHAAHRIVTERTVLADWIFTTPAVVLQPVTGLALLHLTGYPAGSPWILWSIALYILAGACWLPVVWLQLRMRALAREADARGTALPARFWRAARIWSWLGVPAFSALVAVYWLMIARP